MTMTRILPVVTAALLVVLFPPARAAAAQASLRMCLERSGGGNEKEFLAFDRELRAAMSSPDPTVFTLLAAYPLGVNDGDGRTSINDAATLAARAPAVLTAAVRSAVLDTAVGDVICSSSAIGYGRGAVWVKGRRQFGVRRFAVTTINLPSASSPARAGVVFVCRADDHRIVVDRLADGGLRYRSWNRPRTLTDAPTLELTGGEDDFSGSGACAHHSWTFTSGDAEYIVAEAACTAEVPPAGAIGELSVSVKGVHQKYSWCY